jgi:hypothetical protein
MAQQYSRTVTLTSDLSTIAYGFRPTYVRIDPSTAGTAFLALGGFGSTLVATTNSTTDSLSYQLTSGAIPLVIDGHGKERNGMSSGFTAIGATGTSTVIRILAVRL